MFVEKKRTKFLALPLCFKTYFIDEEKIRISAGAFSLVEDDAYMYKVQDVRLKKSMMERIFHTGTVICFTGDTTHPELRLEHIKHSNEVKEFILKASEEARLKRRTLNTVDIDAGQIDSID